MAEPLIVSLEEFAELCGVTPETMRAHLRTVEGQPDWLIEKGDRGRAYKIEPVGGIAWWKARREAEDNASEERRLQLAQLRMDLVGGAVEATETLSLSGRARSEEYGAAFKAIELRKAMGELVVKAELQHEMLVAVVELRRRLMLTPGEFAIVGGLEPEQVRPLEGIIASALDAFVRSLERTGVIEGETKHAE